MSDLQRGDLVTVRAPSQIKPATTYIVRKLSRSRDCMVCGTRLIAGRDLAATNGGYAICLKHVELAKERS